MFAFFKCIPAVTSHITTTSPIPSNAECSMPPASEQQVSWKEEEFGVQKFSCHEMPSRYVAELIVEPAARTPVAQGAFRSP